jgi:DNA-binding response OmpR family regulator
MNQTEVKPEVLLVEDEPSLLEAIAFKLHQKGVSILSAKSGEEALEILKDHTPVLVWLDVLLPGLSGLDVLERMRQDERLKEMPVVMVSVLAGPEKIKHAFDLGAMDYIVKSDNPIDVIVDQVMGHIHALMQPK